MKKYIIAFVSAVAVGSLFAFYMFGTEKEESLKVSSEVQKGYLFQLGVFSNMENATNFSQDIGSSTIIQEGVYYYVYGALYTNEYLVGNIRSYYDSKDIDYAIKEIILSNDFKDELKSYEKLMIESMNIDVILKTNKIILDKYTIL